jgi:uncharacterized protein with HEPN domain
MSRRYPALLLSDMVQAIEEMNQFVEGLSYDDFMDDTKTFRAVFACALILGEAARGLDESVRGQAPEVEWHKIRGLRNRLAHEYFDIDNVILWTVATIEGPKLIKSLERLLKQYPLLPEESPDTSS